jgi:hypothetical protein
VPFWSPGDSNNGDQLVNAASIECKIDCKMNGCDEWICIPSIGMSFAIGSFAIGQSVKPLNRDRRISFSHR